MKKYFLLALLAMALFSGCKKDNKEPDPEPNFSDLVIGKWINTHVDGTPVLTDESFYLYLRSDYVQIFASMNVIDEQNKIWVEDDNCTYSVSDKVITVNSSESSPYSKHLEILVSDISQTSMTYTVQKFIQNGVETIDNKTYKFQRITTDLKPQLLGVWQGRETTEGAVSAHDCYWEYFADGTYNYYYFDEEANMYVNKEDNNGAYFVYGNLLASNFMNSIIVGEEGQYSECWNFSFEGDNMYWTGLRDGGIVKSFSMKKVDNPPVVDFQQAILGTWVNTKINNIPVYSNATYVIKFEPNFMEMFANGFQIEDGSSQWIENNNYAYTINDHIITIEGIDPLENFIHLEIDVQSVSQSNMTYTISKKIINGEEIEDNSNYFMELAAENNLASIFGIWKGKETTSGANQVYDSYLQFSENGSFSYYFMNEETGNYEAVHDGSFFLYGNLLAVNYDSDPSSTNEWMYRCLNIAINGNSIDLSSTYDDGTLHTFSFEKTDTPPMK